MTSRCCVAWPITPTRHHPAVAQAENPYLALLEAVLSAQAELVAKWMLIGFVHGVMNTDNTTISGQSIDYGPCAFMDAFDPATVFSSIDAQGRYAYGNQPRIAQWNLTRFAETLLPLLSTDEDHAVDLATTALNTFPQSYSAAWLGGMRAKLGLEEQMPDDDAAALVNDLTSILTSSGADYTTFFRRLTTAAARGDLAPVRELFDGRAGGDQTGTDHRADPSDPADASDQAHTDVPATSETQAAFDTWAGRWLATRPDAEVMATANPLYIPRNHLVDEALEAATAGDLEPFEQLLTVVARPFTERPGLERYAEPAGPGAAPFITYCGT